MLAFAENEFFPYTSKYIDGLTHVTYHNTFLSRSFIIIIIEIIDKFSNFLVNHNVNEAKLEKIIEEIKKIFHLIKDKK